MAWPESAAAARLNSLGIDFKSNDFGINCRRVKLMAIPTSKTNLLPIYCQRHAAAARLNSVGIDFKSKDFGQFLKIRIDGNSQEQNTLAAYILPIHAAAARLNSVGIDFKSKDFGASC